MLAICFGLAMSSMDGLSALPTIARDLHATPGGDPASGRGNAMAGLY